jgi:hypothetical protein
MYERDLTTGNQVGERSHAKDATYRKKRKRSNITYEEFLLEIIKEKRRDDTDEDKSFIVSGTVVQKAE